MTLSSTSTAHLLASESGEGDGMCQASAGATVKHQPESVSCISRNTTKFGAPGRNRTCDTRFSHHGTAGPFRIYTWVIHHDERTEPHTERSRPCPVSRVPS